MIEHIFVTNTLVGGAVVTLLMLLAFVSQHIRPHKPAATNDRNREYDEAVDSLIDYFNRNSAGNIQYDKLQSYIRRIEAAKG